MSDLFNVSGFVAVIVGLSALGSMFGIAIMVRTGAFDRTLRISVEGQIVPFLRPDDSVAESEP